MPTFEWNENILTFTCSEFSGSLEASGPNHGIRTLVSGVSGNLVHKNLFLLSLYRALATDSLLCVPRDAEMEFTAAENGADILFKASEKHQAEVLASYRILDPNIIDFSLTLTARASFPQYELFLSSYFEFGNTTHVYVQRTRHVKEKGGRWLSPQRNEVVEGCYLAYPRDDEAAVTRFDGRFGANYNPVEWAVASYFAEPLAVMRYPESGVAVVMMADPETCFCLHGCYMPDGEHDEVSSHNSTYFSLFGEDIEPGDQRTARVRFVVAEMDESLETAIELYKEFRNG